MIHLFRERSDDWLRFRKQYVSATETASLVGVNSYLSANKLLKEKSSEGFDRLDNRHMRDGRAAEQMTFALLEEAGWHLDKLSPKGYALVFTDENLGLSSTPDNFRWDVPAVVEVKKTSKMNFEKNWMGTSPPLRYLSQVQTQMHTANFTKAFLVCTMMEDDIPISIYEISYSPDYITMLAEGMVKFKEAKGTGKMTINADTKQQATDALHRSYEFKGIFRFGSEETDLGELFNG